MKIIDLSKEDERIVQETAALLTAAFSQFWPGYWTTLQTAQSEVLDSLQEGRISRVALDEEGTVLGWVGAIEQYNGHVWELHPIAVRPDLQGQGIGRALVEDLEACVRNRGGLTITLGTDDETGLTSLSGIDLYPNVWEHVAEIRNLGRHPYEFYQKLGYVITGVIPDANGPGKPDILMSKKI